MSWKTFTAADKKTITTDWNAAFPSFGVYKPLHLLRRNGPLLTGILLERGRNNDGYEPIFHVHNLTRPFPTVSLSWPRRIPNEYVHIEWHAGKFPDLARKIGELAYLPLSGDLALSDIVGGGQSYLRTATNRYDIHAHSDLALLAGWCGNQQEVTNALQQAEKIMKQWPPAVLNQIGGLDNWLESVRVLAVDQAKLQATAREQIAVHKLEKIPAGELK